jgi:hypothetical protein
MALIGLADACMAESGKTMAITKAMAKRIFKPAPDYFLLA